MGIIIDKTADSPYINFNEQGVLRIEGRSITEDPYSFWQPLIDWVQQYVLAAAPTTRIIFFLEYTNSTSNKFIHKLIGIFDDFAEEGNSVEIVWQYEEGDESTVELGHDLNALTVIPFRFEEMTTEQLNHEKIKIRNKESGKESIITMRFWHTIVRNGHGDEYIVSSEL